MKFKIGIKGRKAQIPGAGDWNITYVDPTTAVNRFSSIKSSILDERTEVLGHSSSVPTIRHQLSKPTLSQTMSNLGLASYTSEFDNMQKHISDNSNNNNINNSDNNNSDKFDSLDGGDSSLLYDDQMQQQQLPFTSPSMEEGAT